jgi:hypothetical protein
MEAQPKRNGDLTAVLLLIFSVVALFADVLFFGKRFFIRDLTRYYYPTKRIIREIFLGGEFPWWNRYYSAGQPMAANPEYEVFYPLQWLILLPSYDYGFLLHVIVHPAIAAVGMYFFLRSLDLRRESSIFGGLIYGLGGVIVSMINLLPILFVIVWCPLVFLFARRAMLRPNLRDASLAGIFMGIQALVGEPTSLVQTWFLLGTYALYRAWADRAGGMRRIVTVLVIGGAMIAAGMLAGSAQLIPAAGHVGESARARPFDFDLVTAWSMPWSRPLELIFPSLFGHIYQKGTWYWASALYPGTGSPFIFSIYAGLLSAALLAGALAVRPRGSRYVLLLCLFSAVLALGGNTPLFRFLYDAGLATSVRYPEKWAFIGLFALMVLSAKMFDRLMEGDRKLIDAALGFTAAIGVTALAMALFTWAGLYETLFVKLWGIRNPRTAEWMVQLMRRDWWMMVGRAAVLLLLLWGARLGWQRRTRLWFAGVVLFTLADLAPISFDVVPRLPGSFFTPPPAVAELDERRHAYRIFHEADWYGGTDEAKKYFGTGESVYWIVRNGIYPQTPSTWGRSMVLERDYDKTALLPTVDLVAAMWKARDEGAPRWREAFMSMSNAWYRAELRPFEEERKRVKGRLSRAQPVKFLMEEEHPRYYFADRIVGISGPNEMVERIVKDDWTPRGAFVEWEPFEPAPGRVLKAAESSSTATIEVESEGTSLLIMSVTPDRYWSATIDGEPAELQIVNVGYQGLVVPAGRHTIRMKYINPLVQAGMGISGLAFLLLFFGAVRGGRLPGSAAVRPEAKPDADHVEEHPEGIPEDPDFGVGVVVPPDGDLGDREPEA